MDKIVVPKNILDVAEIILGEVQTSPSHQMNPKSRRLVYQAFADAGDTKVRVAPRWLAILSSRRVLPLFDHKYPDDPLPREYLKLAIAVLQGKAAKTEVDDKLDYGYDASGNAWGYDEREITWPVWLAANSTYHALVEANGYQPLDHLHRNFKNGVSTDWTDEKLCQFSGDTAADAAMSSAYDARGLNINGEKLLEFWQWWFNEAIEESIFAARHGYLRTR